MSPISRAAVLLLVPSLALMAAEGPAVTPTPAPAPAIVDRSTLNNLDLRLSLGGGGGITTVRDEDLDDEADYEDGSGGGIAVHLIYLRARPGGVGFAVGGGLFAHSHNGEPEVGVSRPEATVHAAGVDVYGAFVWRPTRNWHFELPAVVLSGGQAKVETDGDTDSESGAYGQLAVQVGAYYTFDFGLQLGADLGASGFYANVDRDLGAGVEREFTYSGGGGYINLNVGFRF